MSQNLSDTRRRPGGTLLLLGWAFAGLLTGAVLVGAGVYFYQERIQNRVVSELNEHVLQSRTELAELYAQRDVLEGQLAVESSTRKGLEITLDAVQQELGAARDQIAFFNELLPPGPDGSVGIRGLDIQQKGSMLEFRVLLMRHSANAKPFEGMLQFQATGQIGGEPVTVMLEPVRVPAPDSPLDSTSEPDEHADSSDLNADGAFLNSGLVLQFEQFQRSSGMLQIPAGMTLEEVTLNVLEGQTLRVSRSVTLPAQ